LIFKCRRSQGFLYDCRGQSEVNAPCASPPILTSPTLAELLMPLPAANPFSTMRASLRWYSSEELEDGVTYGGESWVVRGWGGGPSILFFPRCCRETAMLQEGVSDHRHERMTVKALPRSALKMIKTEFFFHLLVSLFAYPSRLDGGC